MEDDVVSQNTAQASLQPSRSSSRSEWDSRAAEALSPVRSELRCSTRAEEGTGGVNSGPGGLRNQLQGRSGLTAHPAVLVSSGGQRTADVDLGTAPLQRGHHPGLDQLQPREVLTDLLR